MGPGPGPAHRWVQLALGMLAHVSGTVAASAPTFLIPYFHLERGLSLVQAGALASAALLGTMATLVLWGVVVDRVGERFSLCAGLTVTTAATAAAGFVGAYPALAACWFAAGAGVASANSASGRLVVGWFPPARRGTAMGIRQAGMPLGIGLSALVVPITVQATDLRTTVLTLAGACAVALVLCAALVTDPPRRPRAEAVDAGEVRSPYRADRTLVRIHAASALLVIPQYTVWTFMLVWLIDEKDWSAAAAGALVFLTQLLGAAGRVGVGWWSDLVGSRMRPMRQVAIAAALVMLVLGVSEPTGVAIAVIVVASVVTVADNGLAFTQVAETSGPWWSGKALGFQNTGQYLTSAAVPPVVGAMVTGLGYGWAFGLVAICALAAIPLVPSTVATPDTSGTIR